MDDSWTYSFARNLLPRDRPAIGKAASIALVLVVVVVAAVAGVYITGIGSGPPTSLSVVVDHSNKSLCVNCSSVSVELTTANPAELIYVVTYDSQTGPEGISLSSRPPLVWKDRIALATPNDMATWYAVWNSTGNINITYSTSDVNINEVIMAFGMSGANTTQPFDTSATVVAVCPSLCTTDQSVTLSTTHPNDFVIGAINAAGGGLMTNGGCCTTITGVQAGSIEYTLTSRPQADLKLVYSSQQDPTRWLFVADAVVAQPPST